VRLTLVSTREQPAWSTAAFWCSARRWTSRGERGSGDSRSRRPRGADFSPPRLLSGADRADPHHPATTLLRRCRVARRRCRTTCGEHGVRVADPVTSPHCTCALQLAQWARWLLVPLVMGLVFLAPSRARFDARVALSRRAMDEMATNVLAGGPTQRGWVGLYYVPAVERIGNGVRFVVDDSGLYRFGFAYTTDEPVLTEENFPRCGSKSLLSRSAVAGGSGPTSGIDVCAWHACLWVGPSPDRPHRARLG
jgi:hypothetical protein